MTEIEKYTEDSFFSISMDLITTGEPMPYDLFVNASARESRVHFVRVFPKGDTLTDRDLAELKRKYPRLYVPEIQRDVYLRSLVRTPGFSDEQKSQVIKDSAIRHLDTLFSRQKEFTSEVLNEAISGCRATVECMIDVIQDFGIRKLQDHISQLSFHDFYTYDHSINVAMYNIAILRVVNPDASRDDLLTAGMGGMLHDIGKVHVPTNILNKPDKLTDEEFRQIRKHPETGREMLVDEEVTMPPTVDASVVMRIVNEHHENFDGTGYPNRCTGPELHQYARITAISDFFDAITTKRSYHEPLSTEEAVAVIGKTKGRKVDPDLFELFAAHVGQISSAGPGPGDSQ